MRSQDVKVLVAFHNCYCTDSGKCSWCHTRVPINQLTDMPLTINKDTGMVERSEPVCDECMKPIREQQEETDRGYENEERADFNSDLSIPEYHYTGTSLPQIGGDEPIPGSNWSTAHDNPRLPDYISLGPEPLY